MMLMANRLDLGAGKILQLDKNPLGYVLRLLESNTYRTPRLAFMAEEFDTLMKSADVVVLGGRVKLQDAGPTGSVADHLEEVGSHGLMMAVTPWTYRKVRPYKAISGHQKPPMSKVWRGTELMAHRPSGTEKSPTL